MSPVASRLVNENLSAIESKPYLQQLSRTVQSRRRCAPSLNLVPPPDIDRFIGF